MVRKRPDFDLEKAHPKYGLKSCDITVILHYGGTFKIMPKAQYIGGEKLVFDFVNVNSLKCQDLESFCVDSVKGDLRFHVLVGGAFKLVIDNRDLQTLAKRALQTRLFHVYVEAISTEDLEDVGEGSEEGGEGEGSEERGEGECREEEGHQEDVDELPEQREFVIGNEISDDEEGQGGNGVDPAYVDDIVQPEREESSEEEDDVVHTCDLEFDEHRVSDDEFSEPLYPAFNPRTVFNPTFVIGQTFSSKQEFRKAVQSHAILTRRNLKTVKNDDIRVYIECRGATCDWRMRLNKIVGESSWQLREYHDHHTCAGTYNVKNLKSTWLSERFIQRFHSDAKRNVIGWRSDTINDINVNVSRQQAYRAKKQALELIQGNPDEQYSKLWAYADELRKTNPGSTVILGVDEAKRFDRFYVCFDALRQGFLGGCRPLIGVDGCFLKGLHGGVLLSAVGIDPNNNLFPVAYSVVASETTETWEWFLTVLKQDLFISNPADFTFISDKQKGLIAAFSRVFPGCEHRFCVRHLHNNLKLAGWTGIAYKSMLWAAAQVTTPGEFRVKMRELKEYNQSAWEWFTDKPPSQWSKAFFRDKSKCDILLNNACESFNSCILEARDKPIITMLEWIRVYLMIRMQKNRDRALQKWRGKICPKIEKILEIYQEKIGQFRAIKCNEFSYQINCVDGTQYTVSLNKWTCSCRSWDITGIPCKHALCAILSQDLLPEDFVDRYYYVETYAKVYEPAIMGISYEQLWGDSMYVPPLPPDFGKMKKRGRPVKARKRGPDEPKSGGKSTVATNLKKLKRQQTTVKCGKCGNSGHNAKSNKCPLNGGVVDPPIDTTDNLPSDGVSHPEEEIHTEPNVQVPPIARRDKGKQKVNDSMPKKRGRPRKTVNANEDPNKIVKPPLQSNVSEHDGQAIVEEILADMDQSEAVYYQDFEGPFVPGPTLFEQLQMGLKDAGSEAVMEAQIQSTMAAQNTLKKKSFRKKQKNPKRVPRDTRNSLQLHDEVEEEQAGGDESMLPPAATQESQNEFVPSPLAEEPNTSKGKSSTDSPSITPTQNTAGVKFRCPRPWLGGGVLAASRYKMATTQPETGRVRTVIVENGKKYLKLSEEGTSSGTN